MNYEMLFSQLRDRNIRMALTGAKGGFGRSLLVQCRAIPQIVIAALCDLDVEGTLNLLASLGFATDAAARCDTREQAQQASEAGKIAVVADAALLDALPLDIVVEATGQPESSVEIALAAIRRKVHVAMVSKETDSVVGPSLNRLAKEHGVTYTTPDGDQPSNLIGLVTWARVLGFEIIAAGKSSEYDYIFEAATGNLTYRDQTVPAPELAKVWTLGDNAPATLARRRQILQQLPQKATPDYCEMNVVANSTGLLPACDALSYPLCHVAELADVFIPEEDGGILKKNGVVDVFNCLRRTDEASFAGGVFITVRCTDAAVWEVLRQKGHLVSRNGKYACIFLPYHLMGLETPLSLFSSVLHNRPSGSADQAVHALMAIRTERAFKAGEVLAMGGHHHDIEAVTPLLLAAAEAPRQTVPFYLAANKRLAADVPAGTIITADLLVFEQSTLYAMWREATQ